MKIIFNFKRSNHPINWVRVLTVLFKMSIKEAKDIVDSGDYVHIVCNLNNAIDIQRYYDDFLIKIDSACLNSLDSVQKENEIKNVVSLSIDKNTIDNERISETVQTIDVQDLDTVKIGSVYIITQERYKEFLKAKQTLSKITTILHNEQKETISQIKL